MVNMDLIIGLSCSFLKHNFYGRRSRLPISWFEVGEVEIVGTKFGQSVMEKVKLIKENLKTAQSRPKSYSNMNHRDLEFQVDDWVFLKVSHVKGVIRFGKKGKLNPDTSADIGSYEGSVFTSLVRTFNSVQYSDTHSLVLDAADTVALHINWGMALLINHQNALMKAQEEIDTKVGKDRWAEESDIKDLVYLQAIVKEFDPERFIAGDIDFCGHHYEFIPFGSGRRSCPGMTYALQVEHLTMTHLIQGFNYRTPNDEALDMKEGAGITIRKVNPVELIITPRLAPELY
uniref:Cytochrome P450 82G1-like n=1 Tax=Nicotiana tabacum TaxID=4097 RepID=A0A1S4ABE7_TOBAC|nr:PREDICTED: cytochrome P450 82G1-like [Nicotiana tabacum]